MGVLTALAILAGLIVVHEAGHFFAATWQGIRVSGFSVGFGPALLKRQRGGVVYALRAIPLGGFVSFPDDEEPADTTVQRDDPDLLRNRPLAQRALVIAAGVLANLALAWAVLLAQGLVLGIPAGFSTSPGVLVAAVQPGQPAARSGLQAGDRIVALQGQELAGGQRAVSELVERIRQSPAQRLGKSKRWVSRRGSGSPPNVKVSGGSSGCCRTTRAASAASAPSCSPTAASCSERPARPWSRFARPMPTF